MGCERAHAGTEMTGIVTVPSWRGAGMRVGNAYRAAKGALPEF